MTTQKPMKMSNKDPTKKTGVNSGAREGKAVPDSYKTYIGDISIASLYYNSL